MFELSYALVYQFVLWLAVSVHGEHVRSWGVWKGHASMLYVMVVMTVALLLVALTIKVLKRYGFFAD